MPLHVPRSDIALPYNGKKRKTHFFPTPHWEGHTMSIRLRACPILVVTSKAAQVRLHSGKILWFPLSQCPELALMSAGEEGEFLCPRWIYEREQLQADAAAASRLVALRGQPLSFTREAAFVQFHGGEQTWLPFADCPGLAQIPINTRGVFQVNELVLNDKELLHYAYTPIELARKVRSGELSLAQVIHSERINPSALHQFAHDCALSLLQRNAQMDTSLMLGLWKAMQCKRQWMVDPDQLQGLLRERQEIYNAWGTLDHEDMRVAAAVWDATEQDPYLAAERSARHIVHGHLAATVSLAALRCGKDPLCDEELVAARQWQADLLAALIEREHATQPKQPQPTRAPQQQRAG